MPTPMKLPTIFKSAALMGCSAVLLAGCSSYSSWLPSAGPSLEQVEKVPQAQPDLGIQLVDMSDAVVRRVMATQHRALFSDTFGTGNMPGFSIGAGDLIEISIWEAPPAVLFGNSLGARSVASSREVLPEQMVSDTGSLNVPFVGSVRALGRTPQEIEQDIVARLKNKANQPQVLVRVLRNVSSNVTIVGEVANSVRMPLTAKGERLLDALAAAGGVRQPVGKVTLQLTREVSDQGKRVTRVQALPLETIIADPAQNVVLRPGDVVTALHQPNSLTVLGATSRNEELNFEAQGITLAQALARAGGLQDQRANAAGVFIFRFEDPAALGEGASARTTPEGKVPVVYKVDLKDPATFFAAQGFPMRNRDVMYVANAPAAELQKFLTIVSSVVIPTVTIQNLTR